MKTGEELRQHSVEITREQITAYAEASGDRNPIHLDEEFAKSVGLPGVIAHGMLQMGLLASWVTELAGDHRKLRRLAVRFAGMALPGDTLTFGGRVTDVTDGVARLEVWGQNQRGDRVLTKGVAEVRVD
ncbi:MAG TPA: MaoC/PaaZ C-terminal domain-containing protein [Candidatus Dormibacteraeota bacterium]